MPARPDKPVRLPSSHASSLRYTATFRLRALFASCSRAFRQVRGSFCRRTAVRRPAPTLSAPSIPASGAGERISLRSRFMWNIRLVIRQNLNIYRGFRSFMHIYTLRHCMFFAYAFAFPSLRSFPVVAPRLTIAPRRRSLNTRFRIPPSRTRAVSSIRVCILFPRSSLSSPRFLDLFSSHTCDRRDVRSFCLYFSLTPDFCL